MFKSFGAVLSSLIAALALVALAGCGGGGGGGGGVSGQGAGGNPQTSTVSGTLMNQVTGQPLNQIGVTVNGTALTATTDANGNFSIANVPSGAQTLDFSVGGTQVASTGETIAGASDNLGTITLNIAGNPPGLPPLVRR